MLFENNEKPIFLQFAEELENNILRGVFPEEGQLPSTTEVSIQFKMNPATANRGVNLLVDEGIVYKKRGIGMFVCKGARDRILLKRKNAFFQAFILPLMEEANSLNMNVEEIKEMIERGARHDRNSSR